MHGFRLAVALACALAFGSADAVDGVIEINQAAALAGGVVPGDAAGFPVTIDQPGSYRLTGNLDLSGLGTPQNRIGIQVDTDDVVIDLNGFAIIGANSCSGSPTTCTLTGTGDGIKHGSSGNKRLRVSNGTVRGMGRHGISCNGCLVEQVTLVQNGSNGLSQSNDEGRAINVHAEANGGAGMRGHLVVIGSTAIRNGTYGIFGQPFSVIRDNSVEGNGGNGVRCFDCALLGNVIANNEGFGVELGVSSGRAGYAQNVIVGNTLGAVTGTGLQTGTNVCGFNTTCP